MAEEISIRLAGDRTDLDKCVLLQRSVWGLEDIDVTSAIQLRATVHAGGMVHLAENAQGDAVGFAYAFAALSGKTAHLHSDMLAVLPDYQKRGVGVRLKWAQRDEALRRGVDLITWTFDPMQARNAHLNLRRLGGKATEFYPDFYGITSSPLHHNLPTDRLLVRWELLSERVQKRASEGEPLATAATPALPRINEVKWQAGWPVSSDPHLDLDDPELLLEIPPEWDVLFQSAPKVAEGWHARVRAALMHYFGRGYIAIDLAPTQDMGRRRPLYVLEHEA